MQTKSFKELCKEKKYFYTKLKQKKKELCGTLNLWNNA